MDGYITPDDRFYVRSDSGAGRPRATDEHGRCQPDRVPGNDKGCRCNAVIAHPVEMVPVTIRRPDARAGGGARRGQGRVGGGATSSLGGSAVAPVVGPLSSS